MSSNESNNQPTHLAKVRHGQGKQASYERIGVGWYKPEDGSLYVQLAGTQVVSEGFTLYPREEEGAAGR